MTDGERALFSTDSSTGKSQTWYFTETTKLESAKWNVDWM